MLGSGNGQKLLVSNIDVTEDTRVTFGSDIPFGKYTLVEKLAEGGMGEVFLAKMRSSAGFEKTLVIKRLLPQLSRDSRFVTMFLDEARIAASLNHPNICQVLRSLATSQVSTSSQCSISKAFQARRSFES